MREIMLIVHFLGLAMGLGTSIGFQFLGKAASKMEKDEALKFAVNSFALGKMAQIGLTLLVISGGYLMTPFWSILPFNTLLIVKLSMVFVLIIFLIITAITIKKAKIGDTKTHLKKIKILGKLSLLTTLIIVVLAVYIFH
jgi:uncharacterized membrane protein